MKPFIGEKYLLGDPECVYYKWDIHKTFCFWSRNKCFCGGHNVGGVLPKKGQKFMRQFRPTMLSIITLSKLDMKAIKIYFKFNGVQFANFFF